MEHVKKPIRILHIVSVMNRGGIETFLMNIYRKINRANVQFDFLVTREEIGIFDEEISALGGKIYNIPHIKKVGFTQYKQNVMRFFHEHHEYKIVHCHMNTWSGFFLPIAKKSDIPIRIAHSHIAGNAKISFKYLPDFVFKQYHARFIKQSATHFFACGKKAGAYLFKNISQPFTIIPNAIEANAFKYDEPIALKMRKELGISKDAFVIGHVGRFVFQKNHAYLLKIFREIIGKKPNAILCLVGDGEYRRDIETTIHQLELENNVKILGIRNDVHHLMMMFDRLVFPSLFEGFPVILVEAQASGLPCIISNTISNEVDLKTGLITFVSLEESPETWAEHILQKKPSNRHAACETIIEKGYDSTSVANWLEQFYVAACERFVPC